MFTQDDDQCQREKAQGQPEGDQALGRQSSPRQPGVDHAPEPEGAQHGQVDGEQACRGLVR
ncbi:hypothetical protein RZS08_30165, partial [Arthrospira platensis SPKY1]|nr:hypothetical protein [Arthrospira platensis SPKY1]